MLRLNLLLSKFIPLKSPIFLNFLCNSIENIHIGCWIASSSGCYQFWTDVMDLMPTYNAHLTNILKHLLFRAKKRCPVQRIKSIRIGINFSLKWNREWNFRFSFSTQYCYYVHTFQKSTDELECVLNIHMSLPELSIANTYFVRCSNGKIGKVGIWANWATMACELAPAYMCACVCRFRCMRVCVCVCTQVNGQSVTVKSISTIAIV